jgi:LysM repeat protein
MSIQRGGSFAKKKRSSQDIIGLFDHRRRMKLRIFLLVGLLAGGWLIVNVQPTSAIGQVGKKGAPNEVINLVNQLRAGRGLSPYQVNSALMASAQAHSEYQASIGSITHTGVGGSNPVGRAMSSGYGGGAKVYVSENIYGGNDASAQQAVNWWQGDAPHLTTMISPNYTDAGVGIAVGGSRVYYTLDAGYVSGSPGSGGNSSGGGGSSQSPAATAGPTVVAIHPVQIATPEADGSIVHVVQPGQALWNIAAAYKIELDELLKLNDLTKDAFIHPGDKITVRAAKGEQSTTPTSQVEISATVAVSETVASPTVVFKSADDPTNLAPLIVATITGTLAFQQGEVLPAGSTKTPSQADGPDMVLLGVGGLVVLGTSLILIGSVGRRRGSGD